MNYYTLHFDGSCRPTNPGGVGYYAYTIHHMADKIQEDNGTIGQWNDLTNNFAEFFALYKGLECLISIIDEKANVEIKGDCDLVIKIMGRKWKGRKRHEWFRIYKECESLVKSLRKKGVTVSYSWIPREKNQRCDFLAKNLDTRKTIFNQFKI